MLLRPSLVALSLLSTLAWKWRIALWASREPSLEVNLLGPAHRPMADVTRAVRV